VLYAWHINLLHSLLDQQAIAERVPFPVATL
jgi:hypothetical protein